jgi:serine/threonine protein phosphatase 1
MNIERVENVISILKSRLDQPMDDAGRAYFVSAPEKGRRFVISDIHGCFQTFCSLLEKIGLKKKDQLFVIGDMVDRGPYSMLVLEKIVNLLEDGYKVFPTRGNHEQIFLNLQTTATADLFIFSRRQNTQHLLNENYLVRKEVRLLLESLPYYFETEDHFLVHAGFNTRIDEPFSDWQSMLWTRDYKYSERKLKSKTVIHGHVPTSLNTIKRSIKSRDKNICIDNGCVKAEATGYGKLICYELNSGEYVSKKNIDLVLAY